LFARTLFASLKTQPRWGLLSNTCERFKNNSSLKTSFICTGRVAFLLQQLDDNRLEPDLGDKGMGVVTIPLEIANCSFYAGDDKPLIVIMLE
jgi:hypothetical protein